MSSIYTNDYLEFSSFIKRRDFGRKLTELNTKRGVFSIEEAARYLGIGRSSMYNLIYQNKIIAIKIGGRRLITRKELFRYLDDLQAETIERARKGIY